MHRVIATISIVCASIAASSGAAAGPVPTRAAVESTTSLDAMVLVALLATRRGDSEERAVDMAKARLSVADVCALRASPAARAKAGCARPMSPAPRRG